MKVHIKAVVLAAVLGVIGALGIAAPSFAQFDNWCPPDGCQGYDNTPGSDGPGDTGIPGFSVFTTSHYYDHDAAPTDSHTHPWFVHMYTQDLQHRVDEMYYVEVLTFRGKCVSENNNPPNYPSNCDGSPGGGLTLDHTNVFQQDWGGGTATDAERNMTLEFRMEGNNAYQVINYCFDPVGLPQECDQEENSLY